jgi:hypothetical protein
LNKHPLDKVGADGILEVREAENAAVLELAFPSWWRLAQNWN